MYDWAKHVADKSRHPGAFKKNRYQEDGAKCPSPVSVLPVLNREKKVTGIVNLTDMLKRGFI